MTSEDIKHQLIINVAVLGIYPAWNECVCIIRIVIVIIRHLIKRLRGTRVANVASEAVGSRQPEQLYPVL